MIDLDITVDNVRSYDSGTKKLVFMRVRIGGFKLELDYLAFKTKRGTVWLKPKSIKSFEHDGDKDPNDKSIKYEEVVGFDISMDKKVCRGIAEFLFENRNEEAYLYFSNENDIIRSLCKDLGFVCEQKNQDNTYSTPTNRPPDELPF